MYRCDSIEQVQPSTDKRPVCDFYQNLPERNLSFTGRNQELNSLEMALQSTNFSAIVQTVQGLGGVGKTQLALEYAHLTLKKRNYHLIGWLNAQDSNTLNTCYMKLADYLRIDKYLPPEERIEQTKHELARCGNWLLIFDDAQDYNSIKDFIPSMPGHVLITSRCNDVAWERKSLALNVFSEQDAIAFLAKKIDKPYKDKQAIAFRAKAKKLADLLGYLPLALAHAGAYINQCGSIKEYIALYKQKTITLFQAPIVDSTYDKKIAITWDISLAKVKEEEPQYADKLLNYCSYLSHQAIPKEFLIELFKDALYLDRAIIALENYSLIEMIENNCYLSMHQLVHEVIKDKYPQEKETSERLAQQLQSYIKKKKLLSSRMLPHIDAFTDYVKKIQGVTFSFPDIVLQAIRLHVRVGTEKDLQKSKVYSEYYQNLVNTLIANKPDLNKKEYQLKKEIAIFLVNICQQAQDRTQAEDRRNESKNLIKAFETQAKKASNENNLLFEHIIKVNIYEEEIAIIFQYLDKNFKSKSWLSGFINFLELKNKIYALENIFKFLQEQIPKLKQQSNNEAQDLAGDFNFFQNHLEEIDNVTIATGYTVSLLYLLIDCAYDLLLQDYWIGKTLVRWIDRTPYFQIAEAHLQATLKEDKIGQYLANANFYAFKRALADLSSTEHHQSTDPISTQQIIESLIEKMDIIADRLPEGNDRAVALYNLGAAYLYSLPSNYIQKSLDYFKEAQQLLEQSKAADYKEEITIIKEKIKEAKRLSCEETSSNSKPTPENTGPKLAPAMRLPNPTISSQVTDTEQHKSESRPDKDGCQTQKKEKSNMRTSDLQGLRMKNFVDICHKMFK